MDTPAANRLRRLFKPDSIAVVGVTEANDYSRRIIQNLRALEYAGDVYAVNPRYTEFAGFPCFPNLASLPKVPDAVAIAVGGRDAPKALAEAGALGVGAAVIFADTAQVDSGGPSGKHDRGLAGLARRHGVALVGPNCQGIVNFHDRNALYLLEVGNYQAGHIALIAQSGGVAEVLSTNRRGVRWSHLIASGNEVDVTAADYLEYLIDQDACHGICMFLETIRDPARFFTQCDRARNAGKPVIILKAGRTEAAAKVAETHSGALSKPDRLLDALMRRHAVLRVDTLEEMLATALAVQAPRRPRSNGVGVIAGSGGLVELVLDVSPGIGLEYPPFAPETGKGLQALLGRTDPLANPLDLWPMRNIATDFPQALRLLAEDPGIDIVVTITHFDWYPTSGMSNTPFGVGAVRGYSATSPALLVLLDPVDGAAPGQVAEAALAEGVLLLSGLTSGLRALEHLAGWSRPPAGPAAPVPGIREAQLLRLLDQMHGQATSGAAGLDFARAAGFTVPQTRIAHDPDEAVAQAGQLGRPVVVKIGDAGVLHKTERGGVHAHLHDDRAIRAAAAEVLASGATSVLMQEQVTGGTEMLLGLQHDPGLGSFVLAGLGGIWTELADDVAFSASGLGAGEAEGMLRGLRAYRVLRGARGGAVADEAAVQDAIYRMDALARLLGPQVASIDINPLIVGPDGAFAVDVSVVPRSEIAECREERLR
jgi:acetate---CoA ligase (ADP-forming)